ncbi:MAG: GDYXXLXY domain-containing protein [Flavobacteriaceae bacterium]
MSTALLADAPPARMWPRILLLAALQIGALVWMIADRAMILNSRVEVTLKVVPIDPRDFFRGDYVTLSYDISRLHVPQGTPAAAIEPNEDVFVRVAPGPDGTAEVLEVAQDRPSGEGVVLRGRLLGSFGERRVTGQDESEGCGAEMCVTLRVDYGIDRYFVPEGKGRDIERITGDGRVSIVAAVSPSGELAIKRLLVDGEPVYDEPLW